LFKGSFALSPTLGLLLFAPKQLRTLSLSFGLCALGLLLALVKALALAGFLSLPCSRLTKTCPKCVSLAFSACHRCEIPQALLRSHLQAIKTILELALPLIHPSKATRDEHPGMTVNPLEQQILTALAPSLRHTREDLSGALRRPGRIAIGLTHHLRQVEPGGIPAQTRRRATLERSKQHRQHDRLRHRPDPTAGQAVPHPGPTKARPPHLR
jgi:hypothetical protein